MLWTLVYGCTYNQSTQTMEHIMQRPSWVKQSVQAGNDYHIRHQSPSKHNTINILAMSLLWLSIISGLYVSTVVHWAWYPLLGVILGAALFAHFILVIHEASHNMLLISKNMDTRKKINHILGVIASTPFFTDYVRHWEDGHVTHHLRPCEADDPQNPNPLYGKPLLKKFAQIWFIPFGFLSANPSSQYPGKMKRLLYGTCCITPVVATLYFLQPMSLIVLYLAFTVLSCLNLCKIAQEHGAGLAHEDDAFLRSRTYFYPLQWLFSPFNINYHYEHHANFNVPWYLLPTYHAKVKEIIPASLQNYYIHHEYIGQMMGWKELPNWETIENTAESV